MVNKKKHDDLKEKMREADRRISEQMQVGFDITSDSFSVAKLYKLVKEGKLHDAPYQRDKVWDNARKRELIESVIRYGGKKIPPVTFRILDDGTMEIVDGKQRILSAIVEFVDNEFPLNGITTPEFTGYKLKDIEENYPYSYGAFMGTEIPVQLLSNMSDEDAIIYFHQVNSSGITMSCGEKIHAMQNTPILKAIESLTQHKVWNNITYVNRYNNYEYTAKMLLYVRDTDEVQGIFKGEDKHKILTQIDAYRDTPVPTDLIIGVRKTFDFLEKCFEKYNFKVSIREFYHIFTYACLYIDDLNVSDFGKFIKELYYFIGESKPSDMDIFRVIKEKHTESGHGYTAVYYKWYVATLNKLFGKFIGGLDWNAIKRISIK